MSRTLQWGLAFVCSLLVTGSGTQNATGGQRATAPGGGNTPIGWASAEGGTTGGQGGSVVTAQDAESFIRYVRSKEPLVIRLSGTVQVPVRLHVQSNKTILGVGSDATITGGGLALVGVSNVILRNLSIRESRDALSIEEGAHHIWVDHCDLSHCDDSLLDVKTGSDFITASWNHFHDQNRATLVGHKDTPEIRSVDTGHLRVTYHHNFFDGTQTRQPRVRFGEPVHVFNNYYLKNEHGVTSVMDAGLLVEGNYFDQVEHPTDTAFGDSPEPGRLVERDNIYVGCKYEPQVRGTVKEPRDAYSYTLDKAADVPELVKSGAGVGKM
jgi:pectate lyase